MEVRHSIESVWRCNIMISLCCWRHIRLSQKRRVGFHLKPNDGEQANTQDQAQESFTERHGCFSAPMIQNQRPWGVDRLEQLFRGDQESRLMDLFLFHFRQTGNTVEQCFIDTTAFAAIDPAQSGGLAVNQIQEFRLWSPSGHHAARAR